MDSVQILVLAAVQGLTEFLPISSSAHLILAPLLFGFELQALSFDVAVHLGTLAAVLVYFRRDLPPIVRGMFGSGAGVTAAQGAAAGRLGWLLVLGTLPVVVFGLPLKALLDLLRSEPAHAALVIAATTIGFGLLLWLADARGRRSRELDSLGWRGALMVGLFQAVAIIPGTSRSGITITAGLFLGLSREAASRFSFLLSIPTIAMAGVLETRELLSAGADVDWRALALGSVLSFLFALLTVHFFLRFIERLSMLPFVLYRLALGALILVLLSG